MHVDRRLLNWGLFFILLGAIPIAVRQGWIASDIVSKWWTLWPLLLVAAGIGLLLSRTSFEFVGGLLTAATLGVMAGGILAVGFAGVSIAGCGDQGGGTAFAARDGQLGQDASVRLELNCGDLTVATAAGPAWRLEGADEDGKGPTVDASQNALSIRSHDSVAPFGKRDRWTVTLPETANLDLNMTINAGRGRLDLGAAALRGVRLNVNAADVRLDLSRTTGTGDFTVEANAASLKLVMPGRSVTGRLSVNAGSIDFCTAAGAGVRIRTNDSFAAGNNFATQGLTRSGNTWETPNYASATVQIDLDGQANAGSLNLNPNGGCNA
jgi:hypothetical protein